LRPIHHFQNGRIKAALHSEKIESGKQESKKRKDQFLFSYFPD